VRFGPKVYRGLDGARLLLRRQTEAIKALKENGITVKINTVIIPGINDNHAPDVGAYCAQLGADVQNCMPMMHVEGSVFENLPQPDSEHLNAIRILSGKNIPQMSHCARCRADAAGLIGEAQIETIGELLLRAASSGTMRPYVAAASMEGLFVNRHLGEASDFWIFALENGKAVLKEQRPAPRPGSGNRRWQELAGVLSDCGAILVSGCGENPRSILEAQGIHIVVAEGLIADVALPILENREIPKIYTLKAGACGAGMSCGNQGGGCG
jgi:nitrogen fixation protein NifB